MSRPKRSSANAPSPPDPPPSKPTPRLSAPTMPVLNPNAAGIDVHSDMHMVCVPAGRVPPGAAGPPAHVRRFGANSCDLAAIADWLKECGVTTVAMESTGVYWIPLFELLESRGFAVWLVEPGQLSHCGARPKTDVLDAQWIQRLHSYGLLRPSFRPPDSILALRGYHRQRQMQIRYAASHTQHMQKALEQLNVKLTEVVSDITGLTGQRIIAAILKGERDPQKLAALRDPKCKNDAATIAKAWKEPGGPNTCSPCGRPTISTSSTTSRSPSATRRSRPNWPDSRTARATSRWHRSGSGAVASRTTCASTRAGRCSEALGVDLTEIEGIDVGTALVVLGEIGVDVSRFPTEKHFASWLGVCPRQYESNKTKHKRSPRKGKNRVAIALRMAAQALGTTQSPMAQFYRRIKSRIGGKGAITATAHKLACLVYRMLKYGTDYVKQSLTDYEQKVRSQLERSLRRKAAALGYQLVPNPQSTQPPIPEPVSG